MKTTIKLLKFSNVSNVKKKLILKLFLKIFILPSILSLASINLSIAQECHVKAKNVPQVVLDGFKTKYPNTEVRKWKKTEKNFYKAKFANNIALFNSIGKWIETRTELKIKELPKEINDSISKTQYRNWTIHDVTKLETPEKSVLFIIQVEKGNNFYGAAKYEVYMKRHELYYDKNGRFIKIVDLTPDSNIW